ncbi:BACON domain-containing protein, partial [Streptomyces albiaxialis]|uniref:BACON domain-containing protein n=1 Tax=Streptomyces albiaxialis TaxID=329523 RepID=UPI0031DBD55D
AAALASGPPLSEAARTQRRRELAVLAWPEAAGIAPEQREALELSVRHGLAAHEVGSVLSLSTEAASTLLSNAACEVERTRAALAVVETGGCPAVARLAGDDRLLMGTALRRELVRHVDECAECRRGAERAMAGVSWPGTAPASATLAVLDAPRPAIHAAVAAVRRARAPHAPRFDKAGFPLDLKVRAARRERLRSKAVTTTVVATVVAAPVLALWAAYRGAPVTGEREADSSVSASEGGGPDSLDGLPYENAGRADSPKPKKHGGRSRSGVSVDVDTPGGRHGKGAGRLKVEAEPLGHGSLITLTATGSSPVRWSAAADAPWLTLSRTGGVLRPGESAAIRVAVDRSREPSYAWEAHVRIDPVRAVVTLEGPGVGASPSRPGGGGGSGGGERPTHGPAPSRPPSSSNPPSPTDPPSSPDPTPTSPDPTPTESDSPSPSPTESEPTVSPSA